MEGELHSHERRVLIALGKLGSADPAAIAKESGLKQDSVMRSLSWLARKNLVEVKEGQDEVITLDVEGRLYAEKGLPERRALELILEKDGVKMEELQKAMGEEAGIAIIWLKKKGLARIEAGNLIPTSAGKGGGTEDEELLSKLKEGELSSSELKGGLKKGLDQLKSRKRVVAARTLVRREAKLTARGRKLVEKGIELKDEATQLTHAMLKSGKWRSASFRRYGVDAPAPELLPAKMHPLSALIEEIEEVFLNMGFTEIKGPLVESAFWNFDALFVPQDHPAREMQDTLYLERPGTAKLPDRRVVDAVSRTHENGGGTGSRGWRYRWSRKLASQTLLRTHTTEATIRHLAANKKPPIKVYSIDRVFRNERITFKHLPEFYQIEGIVVGDVTFRDLLGILKLFYFEMGFEKVRFRPGYFPYTEPSLEVEVYFEEKDAWMELGGAGVFRPEVTEPLGIEYPVLAWGLGLERLAMLRLDMDDIRQFYMSDIDWLRRSEVI